MSPWEIVIGVLVKGWDKLSGAVTGRRSKQAAGQQPEMDQAAKDAEERAKAAEQQASS